MAPYVLRRWDEPHLFDALCALIAAKGDVYGRYGAVTVARTAFGPATFDVYFPRQTELVASVRGAGSYADLEHEALMHYDELVEPTRLDLAEQLAAYDPAMAGRACRTVL